jgi:hypothetical protein
MAELRTRYPRSTALEAMVYLSDEESHDDISTIALSKLMLSCFRMPRQPLYAERLSIASAR